MEYDELVERFRRGTKNVDTLRARLRTVEKTWETASDEVLFRARFSPRNTKNSDPVVW